MKKTLLTCLFVCLLGNPVSSLAYGCGGDGKGGGAVPSVEDAFENSPLVFYGEVSKTTWYGIHDDTLGPEDKVEKKEMPYVPERDGGVNAMYLVYFTTIQVWKDTYNRVKDRKVVILTKNGGWDAIEFKPKQEYIVFTRDDGKPISWPLTEACTRTRPLMYGTDDLKFLREKAGTEYPYLLKLERK